MSDREKWLNGWPRIGGNGNVLMGASVYCVGCGRYGGITCVAIEEDYVPPSKPPDWPFEEANCPVHNQPPPEPPEPLDRLTQRALALQQRRQK